MATRLSAWLLPIVIVLGLAASEAPTEHCQQVTVTGPVIRRVHLPKHMIAQLRSGGLDLVCQITVADTTADDLRIAAWTADFQGRWYQQDHPAPLPPGDHRIRFRFDFSAPWNAQGHAGRWDAYLLSLTHAGGLIFTTTDDTPVEIAVCSSLAAWPVGTHTLHTLPPPRTIHDLTIDAHDPEAQIIAATTGERWSLGFRPHPFPDNPYNPRLFEAALHLTAEDGTTTSLMAFYHQPMHLAVAGDHERATPSGPARFLVRHRPLRPGRYTLALHASWMEGATAQWPLPDLVVRGEPFGGFVQVDPHDPRFLATGDGALHWPIGPNLHWIGDLRGAERTPVERTPPNLGSASYQAYFDRMQAAGVTATEIWMSSWNLALEWNADWPGYHGIGRYNQDNAERLDRILDLAWERGIRINLVIYNHGMASKRSDREWEINPHNQAAGGYLEESQQYFTHPEAKRWQDQLRRYIVARYADHPAILAWKLWSEVNLTGGKRPDILAWHREAAQDWRRLDPYGHPVTTHWAGNYRSPDRAVVALPQIDFVCINAYHERKDKRPAWLLAELISASLHDSRRGLGRSGKPILVTEYGGAWYACPPAQLEAEHRSGLWAGLVSGMAGAPMLWWAEWIDQNGQWDAYPPLAAFLDGEDLRRQGDGPSESVVLDPNTPEGTIWARAWRNDNRWLGYALDHAWGYEGGTGPMMRGIALSVETVPAGAYELDWWNPDTGRSFASRRDHHPGGPLLVRAPVFQRHVAFKLQAGLSASSDPSEAQR